MGGTQKYVLGRCAWLGKFRPRPKVQISQSSFRISETSFPCPELNFQIIKPNLLLPTAGSLSRCRCKTSTSVFANPEAWNRQRDIDLNSLAREFCKPVKARRSTPGKHQASPSDAPSVNLGVQFPKSRATFANLKPEPD